jgi:hypothetical protein
MTNILINCLINVFSLGKAPLSYLVREVPPREPLRGAFNQELILFILFY